ncbi:hypothetical protein MCEMSEM18_03553 [Comamonadaceae bacterium]
MDLPDEKIVVSTNLGAAYRHDGSWFTWDIHNGVSAFKAYPDQSAFTSWEPLHIEPWMRIPTLDELEASKRYQSLRHDSKLSNFWEMKKGWFRPIYYFAPAVSGSIAGIMLLYLWMSLSNATYLYVGMAVCSIAALQLMQAAQDYRSWILLWDRLKVIERHQLLRGQRKPEPPGRFDPYFDDIPEGMDREFHHLLGQDASDTP